MCSKQVQLLLLVIVLIVAVEYVEAVFVSQVNWDEYKGKFGKSYPSTAAENAARFNYAYNKAYIDNHNVYADRGVYTYHLKPTQFSDMRFVDFSSRFPKATWTQPLNDVTPPAVATNPPTAYDMLVNGGVTTSVEDQGSACNAGWAYAAAKSVEILKAATTGPALGATLSAQIFIDCAGVGKGCKNQMPYAAFEFLAASKQDLYLATDYKNNKTQAEQGACIRPSPTPATVVKVDQYAIIPNGRDDLLAQHVGSDIPVVVEFDPTSFQFMHYARGRFQQPLTKSGSHFMTVVGYNATTWKLLNSFGLDWGENGYFYLNRNSATPVTKSAAFPIG